VAAPSVPISDPTLLAELRRYGKFDPTGCYQCGSCTISCDLVQDIVTFPRRSIRFALLGLREPLLGSLDPWVCHDCGDCSVVCPRGSDPRLSMDTIRRFLTAEYDWIGVASKLLESTKWYVGSLIGMAVFTMLLILGYHLWYVAMPFREFSTTALPLEHMFPIITYYTLTVILLPLLLLFSRVFRIWRLTMGGEGRENIPVSTYIVEAWVYVYQSLSGPLMRKCPKKDRWFAHWLLALGTFTMLTVKLFGLHWFQTDNIYPLYHPQRWVGYLAFAGIAYGIGDIFYGRLRKQKEFYKETEFRDWVFPVLLLLTVLSGLAAHVFRYLGLELTCHFSYALHVIFATPMLVVEMSFGKWSHMVYRPLALYFLAVKERARRHAPAAEVVPHAL